MHVTQKLKLKLIVVVIQKMNKIKKLKKKKDEQLVFVMVLRTFVRFDKEALADMKYQSAKYIIIIGFSDADKVSSFFFCYL